MIQIKLIMMGLTAVATIGYAIYSQYKKQQANQEENQQYKYEVQPKKRSQTSSENIVPKQPTFILECSICLESINAYSRDVWYLQCSHVFHNNCIIDWLTSHNTCPNCRKGILKK